MPWLWVCQEDPQTPGFNGTIGGGGGGIMMGSNLPGRKEGASVLEVHCTFKAQFWELHWAWGK